MACVNEPTAGSPEKVPDDVVTGFWLWAIALPLMLTGYVVAVVGTPGSSPVWLVNATTAVFAVITAAIVTTFLILLRHGYRWARTLLTGGGVASVVYVSTNLFGFEAPPVLAVLHAVTSIVGSVLIVGGVVLLHRKDAHAFLVR